MELFTAEQKTVKTALSSIVERIEAHGTHYGEIKSKLAQALELLENCGAAYSIAPERIKRAFNQAIFEKILISPGGVANPVYAEPYKYILNTEVFLLNSGAEHNVANTTLTSFLVGKEANQNTGHKNSHFFGRCFSKNILVENTGIEPVTS